MMNAKNIGILLLLFGAVWATSYFTRNLGGILLLVAAGGAIAAFGASAWLNYRAQQNAIALLMDACDPEAFLAAFEKLLVKMKPGPAKDSLLLSKAAGLCYAGRIDEGLELVRQIDGTFLEGIHRVLYDNNLLAIYLMSGRKTEVRKVWREARERLEGPIAHPELAVAVKGCIGAVQHLEGQLEAARSTLESIPAEGVPRLMRAVTDYYLGLVNRDLGNAEDARRYLESARQQGGKTVYARWAEAALRGVASKNG